MGYLVIPRLPYGIDLRDYTIQSRQDRRVHSSKYPADPSPHSALFVTDTETDFVRDDRLYVIVQRLQLVILWQGLQRGVGEIPIRHDAARERHKK
jgi:hypothetical protein